MIDLDWFYFGLWGMLGIGFMLGQWGQARQWREVGNHKYMNRKESGGKLYQVKLEKNNPVPKYLGGK